MKEIKLPRLRLYFLSFFFKCCTSLLWHRLFLNIFCTLSRIHYCTSGVQTRGPLTAVQLPFLDLEVGTGPLQTSMAPQFSEELQHRPLASCRIRGTPAPHQGPFSNTNTAASAPGPRSHHFDLRDGGRNASERKTCRDLWCVCNPF